MAFDIKRDSADWHTMEGGGFLFNASVRENVLKGFCLLVTQQGLKLYQLKGVDVDRFREGKVGNIAQVGTLLGTYKIGNVLAEHSLKLLITNQDIVVTKIQ